MQQICPDTIFGLSPVRHIVRFKRDSSAFVELTASGNEGDSINQVIISDRSTNYEKCWVVSTEKSHFS